MLLQGEPSPGTDEAMRNLFQWRGQAMPDTKLQLKRLKRYLVFLTPHIYSLYTHQALLLIFWLNKMVNKLSLYYFYECRCF